MASHRSRRWKSGSAPEILTASSQTSECVPATRIPVELHEARLARVVDEAEGVHAEALHHAIAARDGAVRHHPHQHVRGLGHQRDEVPERVVRGGGLRHARGAARASRRGRGPGNFIASWMKNTGMLLPTRSQLPSSV